MKKKYIYIFFIFFFILWQPIHTYIFPYDADGRIISIFGLLFILVGLPNYTKNFISKGGRFDIPFFIWVLWVVVNSIIFNPIMDPDMNITIYFNKVILPFVIYFGIRLNLHKISVKNQWLWVFLALLAYLLLVLIFEKNNPEIGNRFGLFINANEIAWVALLTLITAFLSINNKYFKYFVAIIVLVLIILTASKKALLSYLFFFTLYFLFNKDYSLIRRISIVSIFLIVLVMSSSLLLNNTVIGQRIKKSIEKNEMVEDDSELFDGRANYYIVGLEIFKDRPITGIGITNFLYLGGLNYVAHSEYVVQFAELGIIGLFLIIIFHYRIIKKLIKVNRRKRIDHIPTVLLISFFVFYGMFLGMWIYDNIPYSIFLALTVNTILSYNKKINIKL